MKALGEGWDPRLDGVSQPECSTSPTQEQVNMTHAPPEICKRSIFHLDEASFHLGFVGINGWNTQKKWEQNTETR